MLDALDLLRMKFMSKGKDIKSEAGNNLDRINKINMIFKKIWGF